MKKVVLLGDSIRQIGYGPKIPELLGEEYTVWQPAENCRFVKHTLRMLFDYQGDMRDCDIIHWNNGLWDNGDFLGDGKPFSSLEEYTENMVRLGTLLKRKAPRVIFATTTPVRDNNPHNKNTDIIEYNRVIVPKLMALGIEINDLHAAVYPRRSELICDDLVHLTPEGIELCAGLVADAIRNG